MEERNEYDYSSNRNEYDYEQGSRRRMWSSISEVGHQQLSTIRPPPLFNSRTISTPVRLPSFGSVFADVSSRPGNNNRSGVSDAVFGRRPRPYSFDGAIDPTTPPLSSQPSIAANTAAAGSSTSHYRIALSRFLKQQRHCDSDDNDSVMSTSSKRKKPKSQKYTCKAPGCTKWMRRGGYCFSHGGGSICSIKGCQKSAQAGGKCFLHAGKLARCKVPGCYRIVWQSRAAAGLCKTCHKRDERVRGEVPPTSSIPSNTNANMMMTSSYPPPRHK